MLFKYAGGDIREMVGTEQRNLGYGLQMLSDGVFAFGMEEARAPPGHCIPEESVCQSQGCEV